ncbi:hexulose-6-phosphate synthase [Cedecea neteri]|uniref:Hexulose-6-phosphate synthase n=1 Tax=Cedecea neteri TaxID=158822 RepID=A0AAN0S5J9_9ENTR|nr:type II toxin-antitoxin system HicA family toxin [Cedecea neteri]AIR61973.1 hexulose-6-phosphate synthase [Cedecea neteri]
MEGIMGYGKDYLRNKHHQTLIQIFTKPVPFGVKWQDVERLILAPGGDVSPGRGSRIRFQLNGSIAHYHRPHPSPETDKGAITNLKECFESIGVTP